MTHAIRIHSQGGPEVLKWEEVTVGAPGPNEVRLKATAIGLNFIDTYHRSGLYKIPLPSVLGREGAAVVEEVGATVTDLKVGDRVAYAASPIGAYAEARLMPADKLLKIPAGVSDNQAASIMLKGMTAQYLIRHTHQVKAGDTILMHAAAGGVGMILCQWARHLGATVIGTVGSDEKISLAKTYGCNHVINYAKEDFVARVAEITGGKKCDVVYDGVGKDTFLKSLDCTRPRGLVAVFGNASGAVPLFDVAQLGAKGSLFVTRPSVDTYTSTRAELVATADDLFDVVVRGIVKIEINQTYALKDAAQAHRDLEARKTTGSTVLIP